MFLFFLARFRIFCENLGSLSLFFLFRRRVMFLTKNILAHQVCSHYYNTTQCFLLGSANYFRVYSLSNIINLGKWQVLFNKLAFEKMPFFPTKKLGKCLFFWANLNFRCFTHWVGKIIAINHSTGLRKDFATILSSWWFFCRRETKSFSFSGYFDFCKPEKWMPKGVWRKSTEFRQKFSCF